MVSCVKQTVFLTAALSMLAPRAFAQGAPDPAASARVHIGPLAMTPTLALTNAGIDKNVFNEPKQASPKSDFTMTVEPKTELWLHVGRSVVSGSVTEDLVYYKKYTNQRSANSSFKVGLLVPLTRLTLRANAAYLNTRDRPGFEIDLRAKRRELLYDGSVELLALSRTSVGVKATRQKVEFASNEVFLGANLQNELGRQIMGEALTLRHQLTPLTTINLDVGRQRDRFESSPLRDSDSRQANLGVQFDPFALLKGGATVGYRDFKPLAPGIPSYQGLTAAVDLTYVALGATRLSVQAMRDVQFSFDVNQPYYIQTGVSASLAQQIFGPVDVVGRVGAQQLDYRTRAGAPVAAAARTDYIRSYGGGVGYHIGKDVRFGFNVDSSRRTSEAAGREYDGFRYGTAVTYGF